MIYFYLLAGGGIASFVHIYLVWIHRGKGKYSISENAVVDTKSHTIYFLSHVACEILILMFSYRFYVVEHKLFIPHYLNICFAFFDFMQAALSSKGKTEKIHYATAYVSWVSYIASGIFAFILLDIAQPFRTLSLLFLVPAISMFTYIHFNRSKLYPYQLAIVPSYVIYLLFVVIGSH